MVPPSRAQVKTVGDISCGPDSRRQPPVMDSGVPDRRSIFRRIHDSAPADNAIHHRSADSTSHSLGPRFHLTEPRAHRVAAAFGLSVARRWFQAGPLQARRKPFLIAMQMTPRARCRSRECSEKPPGKSCPHRNRLQWHTLGLSCQSGESILQGTKNQPATTVTPSRAALAWAPLAPNECRPSGRLWSSLRSVRDSKTSSRWERPHGFPSPWGEGGASAHRMRRTLLQRVRRLARCKDSSCGGD